MIIISALINNFLHNSKLYKDLRPFLKEQLKIFINVKASVFDHVEDRFKKRGS